MKTPEDLMRHCLYLGHRALESGNPPVGAILVYRDKIIGEGIESGKSTGDYTNHAEILAIRDAIEKGNIEILSQSTMYSTHEPCVMCSYLIRAYKIATIVYGTDVKNLGGASSKYSLLRENKVPNWGDAPLIVPGILEEESMELTKLYEKKHKGM
ncbi:nucleoside deaminase [Arenibacter sp. F20364]|uniref:nucleoside deaminase n=1 Tax=Arenibacter sp. F20364 TaxID=2926415 RepID=UPI001FF66152|nr:nucleoside deaminase [Arenibacter sp. F20364]MCK0192603.1 nucleoside deaminase [Arenibacter sp. F20364]